MSDSFYMVFAGRTMTAPTGRRWVNTMGGQEIEYGPSGKIQWESGPVGVYRASSPEAACQAAAKVYGGFGTFFAVEGIPWGVALQDSGAEELDLDFGLKRPALKEQNGESEDG